jgi:hypothetical protein
MVILYAFVVAGRWVFPPGFRRSSERDPADVRG